MIDIPAVRHYLKSLQAGVSDLLGEWEAPGLLRCEEWERPEGGGGESRVLEGGEVFERGGVGFSDVRGKSLPPSATVRRPELAGRSFHAMGVSVVIHPRNPHVPTSHMNVRLFVAEKEGEAPVWWFGGGFDLTPYYGYEDDAVFWHQQAAQACDGYGDNLYPRFKNECDEYFYLKHRGEARGIGGIFYDDFNEGGFENSFGLMKSVGDTYVRAYRSIVELRREMPWSPEEREFQLYRRGRYVEFNLVYDRGTLFGLQSNGRTESILMSMPPQVSWKYNWQPEEGTPEAALYSDFLRPRDWLAVGKGVSS